MVGFSIVEHPADIAIEVRAESREDLFRGFLSALTAILTGRDDHDDHERTYSADQVKSSAAFDITASGFDDEERLVAIMNELLYACQVDGWFPVSVRDVNFDADGSLVATMIGDPQNDNRKLTREVKAVTYHNLTIKTDPQWSAKLVIDV